MKILYNPLLLCTLLITVASCTRVNHQENQSSHVYTQQEKNAQLAQAILDEDIAAVTAWIECGADINHRFLWDYHTPLTYTMLQCYHSTDFYYAILALLITHKDIMINKPTSNGITPLMFAAEYGNTAIMKDLLKLGAETAVRDVNGNSALSLLYACYYNKVQRPRQLSDAGGCISCTIGQELDDYEEMIKFLVQQMTDNIHDQQLKKDSIKKIIDEALNNYGKNLILLTSQIK